MTMTADAHNLPRIHTLYGVYSPLPPFDPTPPPVYIFLL